MYQLPRQLTASSSHLCHGPAPPGSFVSHLRASQSPGEKVEERMSTYTYTSQARGTSSYYRLGKRHLVFAGPGRKLRDELWEVLSRTTHYPASFQLLLSLVAGHCPRDSVTSLVLHLRCWR